MSLSLTSTILAPIKLLSLSISPVEHHKSLASTTSSSVSGSEDTVQSCCEYLQISVANTNCGLLRNLIRTADYLSAALEKLGFILLSKTGGEGLPLVAVRLDPEAGHQYDEFAIAHNLRERGWVVPAYTMAPHAEKMKLMRVVVREDFTRSRCDALIQDFKLALDTLNSMDELKLKQNLEHQKRFSIVERQRRPSVLNSHFTNEEHSLKGKHGKTHAVC
jgi:glutamate decarboxylase